MFCQLCLGGESGEEFMTQAKNGVIIKSYWVVKMSLCAIVSGYCHCWLILCWFILIINRVAVTGLLQSHNSGRGPSTVSQHRTWKLRDLYGVLRLHDLFKVKIMNLEFFELPEIVCHVSWTCTDVSFHSQGICCFPHSQSWSWWSP